jgi:hypothetical protein
MRRSEGKDRHWVRQRYIHQKWIQATDEAEEDNTYVATQVGETELIITVPFFHLQLFFGP